MHYFKRGKKDGRGSFIPKNTIAFISKLLLVVAVTLLMIPYAVSAQNQSVGKGEIFPAVHFDSTEILLSIRRSREMHKIRHNEKDEYAEAQKAVDLALALKDTLLYARALDNLGLLYRFHHLYLQALPLHKKAFDLVETRDVPVIFKMIFANNTGVAARYGEQYGLSVSYYLKALAIAEKENDLKNIAIASNGLGNALDNMPGSQPLTLQYFNRALATEKSNNNARGIAMNLLSISHHHINNKSYSEARKYLNELKSFNTQSRDEHGLAITDEYFGLSYLKEGKNYEKAHDYFRLSFRRFEKLNNKIKQAELLSLLGEVSMARRQDQKALDYFGSAEALADMNAQKSLMVSNSMNVGIIYERLKKPQEALKHYKIAQKFKDSINLHQQQIEIAALTANYELEKKEARIENLELETNRRHEQILLRDEKIKQQQTILWLIVFLIILIITLFLMLLRNIQVKRKTSMLLEKQEKEKLQAEYERNLARAEMLASRMKINPHFLFNCLNAIHFLIQQGEYEKAGKYLILFSRFVRLVLETSKNALITLKEEFAFIRHYLTLEKIRFDERFSFLIHHEEDIDLEKILIPPLLLQPFVENALIHGLLPSKKDTKELIVKVNKTTGGLEMIIDDNGVGRPPAKYTSLNKHRSMGMDITAERIALFNKNYNHHLECIIEDKRDVQTNSTGTTVKLLLKKTEKQMPVSPF